MSGNASARWDLRMLENLNTPTVPPRRRRRTLAARRRPSKTLGVFDRALVRSLPQEEGVGPSARRRRFIPTRARRSCAGRTRSGAGAVHSTPCRARNVVRTCATRRGEVTTRHEVHVWQRHEGLHGEVHPRTQRRPDAGREIARSRARVASDARSWSTYGLTLPSNTLLRTACCKAQRVGRLAYEPPFLRMGGRPTLR